MGGGRDPFGVQRRELVGEGDDLPHLLRQPAAFLVGEGEAGEVCDLFDVDQRGVLPLLRPGAPFLLKTFQEAQDFQLFGADGRRGVGHRAGGVLDLGEGDDLPERVGAAEDHHEPVQPEGEAAVGRGAVAEGVDHKAEPVLDLLFRKAEGLKHPLLHLLVVDPDGAGTQLGAV